MTIAIREPAPGEAAAIAALLNTHAAEVTGGTEVSERTVRGWLRQPDAVFRVAELDGRLVSYGDLVLRGDGMLAELDVREHPAGAGAANRVYEELEGLAVRGSARLARATVSAADAAARELLVERGYRVVRHSFRLLLELDPERPPPAPRWPRGISVREMAQGEEREVHGVIGEAFAGDWFFDEGNFETWSRWNVELDGFDRSLAFVATEGPDLAGVCLCSMHQSGDPRLGWVGELGVRPDRRRRGIGLALLRHAFAVFHARGCDRVGLGVDAENEAGALRLYRRAGMRIESRQDTFEKALAERRPESAEAPD